MSENRFLSSEYQVYYCVPGYLSAPVPAFAGQGHQLICRPRHLCHTKINIEQQIKILNVPGNDYLQKSMKIIVTRNILSSRFAQGLVREVHQKILTSP